MDPESTGSTSKANDVTSKSGVASHPGSDKFPVSTADKPPTDIDEEEETRVITLDTIIRKGLVEQMPMTAKDINSIVALSMQKEREKQAADRLRLAAIQPRHIDYDEEDETDSSEYNSSNENDFNAGVASPKKKINTLVFTKEIDTHIESPSVIQRAPREVRTILVDETKNAPDDAEDFELKSGDLHYSESNPSDYSESENRLSSSQSSAKKRLTLTRKRDLSPIAESLNANRTHEETAKKQRIELSTSCTDSKRNAILLQCSSGFVGGAKLASPKLSLVDDLVPQALSPSLNVDMNESSDHSGDLGIDIESMLQVQHSMLEEDDRSLLPEDDGSPIVVKMECLSPTDNILGIHHVEDYRPDIPATPAVLKTARGERKSKSNYQRNSYSDSTSVTKTSAKKRVKKNKDTLQQPILDQSPSDLPMGGDAALLVQTPSSSGTLKQRQSQKRDKRQTVRSNPVYAELSEDSCDHLDLGASKAKQPATIETLTTATSSSPKMHWKTQLKIQRKNNESAKSDDPSLFKQVLKLEQSTNEANIVDGTAKDREDGPTMDDVAGPSGLETKPQTIVEDATVVNKIIEPPHNKKRIPKLKYGSFNFTERKTGLSNGPKMVLKYKKKYKKKTKSQTQLSSAETMVTSQDVMDGIDEVPTKQKAPKIRRSTKERVPSATDTEPKALKSDQPANVGRSIKERNRVLLEILDQRSCEIRNLKMRLANMVRTSNVNVFGGTHPVPQSFQKERPPFVVKTELGADPKTPDWSPNELIQAVSLQKLNRKLYAHVQQRYSLPLPLPTEIDEFIGKLRIETSRHLLDIVMNMLRCDGEHMTELERVSVLQIAQIPLKHSYSYVERSDSILHSNSDTLFVILVRGLVGDWQHPIYINGTDENLTNMVKAAITQLNDIQFNVIACCSSFEDSGSSKMWTDLGVCRGYSYFSHPVTNDPIYTFYYVDDILSSVHQHLMAKEGFHTDMGATINREPVDALLQNNPAANSLRTELDVPATFFTSKTIDLLRLLRPEHFGSCSDFVEVFAAFQQMMRTEQYGGEHLEHQLQVLSHVQLQLYKLKCHGTNAIPTFTIATTHSIESLKLLQHSMRQKYGVDSFPGRSVSEDFTRTLITSTLSVEQAVRTIRNISFSHTNADPCPAAEFDLVTPEHSLVHQIIECIAQKYGTAEKSKFVQDLWRIEEKFAALWTPFFAGNVHVLRDTLGKAKPIASLEGAVEFVRKRIELRVGQVNALGGLVEWASYQRSQKIV